MKNGTSDTAAAHIMIVTETALQSPDEYAEQLRGVVCLDLDDTFWRASNDPDAAIAGYSETVIRAAQWVDSVQAAALRRRQAGQAARFSWQWVACLDKARLIASRASLAARGEWQGELNRRGIVWREVVYEHPETLERRHDEIRHLLEAILRPVTPARRPAAPARKALTFKSVERTPKERAETIAAYAHPTHFLSDDDFDTLIGSQIGMPPRGFKIPRNPQQLQYRKHSKVFDENGDINVNDNVDPDGNTVFQIESDNAGLVGREDIAPKVFDELQIDGLLIDQRLYQEVLHLAETNSVKKALEPVMDILKSPEDSSLQEIFTLLVREAMLHDQVADPDKNA